MWLDELSKLIGDLDTRIKMHGGVLRNNESTTRYALVDPLLSALGWHLSDPAQVRTEYVIDAASNQESRKRLDYAMWLGERICLVVEAKALGVPLNLYDKAIDQAIAYCYRVGCQHFVVTNGDQWKGYALMGEGQLEERCTLNFTVTDSRGVMDLFWLWPGNFKGETKQPNLHGRSIEETVSHSTTTSRVQHTTSGVPLPDVLYERHMEKPRRLVFPNGETKDVSDWWWRIQARTAEWLIDNDHVRSLPVETKQGVTLLHKQRTHFRDPKEVRGHWIEANAGAKQHLTKARQLLVLCEVDPTTVHVELS